MRQRGVAAACALVLGAHGRNRRLLAKIALRPLAFWFGNWYDNSFAKTVADQYLSSVTGGDPNVLAQVTVFRIVPWEGAACSQAPSGAAQASYRRGFALNATQDGSMALELEWGARILESLGARGIRAKHFVINTAQNGARHRRAGRRRLSLDQPAVADERRHGVQPPPGAGSRRLVAVLI